MPWFAASGEVAGMLAVVQRHASRSYLLVVVGLAAACAAGAAPSDEPVAGTYRSNHLGAEIEFPPNWTHRAAGDTAHTEGGIRERTSQFYTGDAKNPGVALSLRMSDPVAGLPPYAQMTEDVMLRSSRGGAEQFASQYAARDIDCEVIFLAERMTGRCVASLDKPDKRLRVHFFAVGELLGSAIFLHGADDPTETMDAIVGSIK